MSDLRLILASGSPHRHRLLRAAGLGFDVLTQPVDEESVREALQAEGATAEDAATALAELKAQRVAHLVPDNRTIVLGFDQILECEGRWFGKPSGRDEARRHLTNLRGRRHGLATAAVAFRGGARVWHHVATPSLWMRAVSDQELDLYLDACGDAVTGTVGAYELEGRGAQLMARVDGDFFTILGVPLFPVLQFLRDQRFLPQ
jgi:septum formation protein